MSKETLLIIGIFYILPIIINFGIGRYSTINKLDCSIKDGDELISLFIISIIPVINIITCIAMISILSKEIYKDRKKKDKDSTFWKTFLLIPKNKR